MEYIKLMHTKIKRETKTTFTNEIANQYWESEFDGDMHRELSQLEVFVSRWNENDHFRLQFCSTSVLDREDDKDKSKFCLSQSEDWKSKVKVVMFYLEGGSFLGS